MMAFLLFLIVFAITYNNGMARSTYNGIANAEVESLGTLFHLPTPLRPEFMITLNGTLDKNDKLFKVVLRGDKEKEEYCKIEYDFETGLLSISDINNEKEIEKYFFKGQGKVFELRIRARNNEIGEYVSVTFQVNNIGESSHLFCEISNFREVKYLEIQKGVESVDSFCYSNSIGRH